jgi:hypothetical protein
VLGESGGLCLWEGGGVGGQGIRVEGRGLLLMACFTEIFENGFENFVVVDRVVIVEVVVGRSLLNEELSYGIEVDAFFVEI